MNFSYFNFWIRNSVLYLFFCILGLIMVLLDKNHPIHWRDKALQAVCDGAIIILIAYIQVIIHNILHKNYFGKYNLRYLFGTLSLAVTYFLISYFTRFKIMQNESPVTVGVSIFLIYLIGLGFYYIHKNILERNLLFKTELIERDEEIRHLKAQLNPHFLFNALNNLYATALTEPDETPDKILELSELLRYQIESSKKEQVSLSDEISFIKKYLNYEQNRNPKLNIDFETEIHSQPVSLSPMLFMPFIENAIKYSSNTDSPFFSLSIKADRKKLTFKLRNNYNAGGRKFSGTNTGLSNTRKRLELMYRTRHELKITEAEGVYDVELSIQL
jgi:sensor histidine kinase YesM